MRLLEYKYKSECTRTVCMEENHLKVKFSKTLEIYTGVKKVQRKISIVFTNQNSFVYFKKAANNVKLLAIFYLEI